MLRWQYLVAFGLTLVVEVPLYAWALAGWFRLGWRPALLVAVAVNAVTHPPLWWSLRPWTAETWYPWLLGGAEAAVCATEWLLLIVGLTVARRRAPTGSELVLLAAVSIGVNAASVLVGALVKG